MAKALTTKDVLTFIENLNGNKFNINFHFTKLDGTPDTRTSITYMRKISNPAEVITSFIQSQCPTLPTFIETTTTSDTKFTFEATNTTLKGPFSNTISKRIDTTQPGKLIIQISRLD